MTEKSINKIIFDPNNMALTLIASIFLFSVLYLDTLLYKTSPLFYWHLFITITFTLLWFVIVLKYQIDQCVGFIQSLNSLKTRLKLGYSKSLFIYFSVFDWVFLVILTGMLIFCIWAFKNLNEINIDSFNFLSSGKLTQSEEKIWELLRSEAMPMTGLYLSLSILIMSQLKEIFSEAKNKAVNKKMDEKYDTIIKKLDEIQEKQNRE